MKKKFMVVGMLVISGSAFSASKKQQGITIQSYDGTCAGVVIADAEIEEKYCSQKLFRTTLPNGRVMVTFTSSEAAKKVDREGFVLSLSGYVEKTGEVNKKNFNVDMVRFGDSSVDSNLDASGSCKFSEPSSGVTKVICMAQTKDGVFGGGFQSDGTAPVVKKQF